MSESFQLTPAELKAIAEHRQRLESERRRKVTVEEAIVDFLVNYKRHWMAEKQRSAKYIAIWREEREWLEHLEFQRMAVRVANSQGLHVRPSSHLSQMVGRYLCSVYVSKQEMPYFNFMMLGKPYMNVKSILGFLSPDHIFRDELEFVAAGPDAAAALTAIGDLVCERMGSVD